MVGHFQIWWPSWAAPLLRCIGWVSCSSQSDTEVFATQSTSFGCRELKLGYQWIDENDKKRKYQHTFCKIYTPCWSCELFAMQTAHLACSPRDQCLPTIQRKPVSWILNLDTFYYKGRGFVGSICLPLWHLTSRFSWLPVVLDEGICRFWTIQNPKITWDPSNSVLDSMEGKAISVNGRVTFTLNIDSWYHMLSCGFRVNVSATKAAHHFKTSKMQDFVELQDFRSLFARCGAASFVSPVFAPLLLCPWGLKG